MSELQKRIAQELDATAYVPPRLPRWVDWLKYGGYLWVCCAALLSSLLLMLVAYGAVLFSLAYMIGWHAGRHAGSSAAFKCWEETTMAVRRAVLAGRATGSSPDGPQDRKGDE
ncbi:MAG: hypothetical protein AB1705_15400 [Verrucomicrobiota bacterium]